MTSPNVKKINYQYFISAADTDLRVNYSFGLTDALKRYGVDSVILSTVEKKHDEDTFIVLVKNEKGEALGGIRIEIRTDFNRIPLEKSNIPYKGAFVSKLRNEIEKGQSVAEICGLWVSSGAKGLRLGERLALEATELALGLGTDIITSMLPTHTLNYFTNLGFVVDPVIPAMAYPDDRYISTVVWYYRPQPAQIKLVESQFSLDVS